MILDRPIPQANAVVNLYPDGGPAGVRVSCENAPTYSSYCTTWTGTLTMTSAEPSWSMSLNLTCTTDAGPCSRVVGTISGNE